jgi:sugar lactone lactonase YvrE
VAPLPDEYERVLTGLSWPESPRWHGDSLWFSDVHNFRVMRWRPGSDPLTVCQPPGRPGGMGFTPDGRLLLSTSLDKKLWWVSATGQLSLALAVDSIVRGVLNDMIVDANGRAWFGDTGFDLLRGEARRSGALLTWAPGESAARIAAEGIEFPNGLVMSADGLTLYLAETFGRCITAFNVRPNGDLTQRRVHAALEERPDGLCGDRDNALWVPLLWKQELQRIGPDGSITKRIIFEHERAISCVFGGSDRRSLYAGISRVDESDKAAVKRIGTIVKITADVPGGGIP